ncbi:hypothetical protein ABT288_39300 [Streptomyces sp. NPDC001093]
MLPDRTDSAQGVDGFTAYVRLAAPARAAVPVVSVRSLAPPATD